MSQATVSLIACFGIAGLLIATTPGESDSDPIRISTQPVHSGRIGPMLFGNFVELLDDLVPGMWAEMLNDRGFDGVTKLANWCYYNGEPNMCDREWEQNDSWGYDALNPFNGSRSVKLTTRKSTAARISQGDLAAEKGKTYLFSAYLRGENPDLRSEVMLKVKLPDGRWMVLGSAKLPALSGQWKKYTARLVSKGSTDRAVFELKVSGSGNVWADKLSLMPEDTLHGWRGDVVEAIREMKPAIIRWGGLVCDPGGYQWKKGIGDRDMRVPFPNTSWGRIDSNDVGIDEFCRFCELVGAEPLVCVSFSDGPESAADLVHYCNDSADTVWGRKRAKNGHPEPYKVRYWQLGNELGTEEYVNGLPAFCDAMKRADPTVVLMASYPSQALLDKVGPQIDFIGPHHYTPDFATCEKDFKRLPEMVRNTPDCGHIKIGVTEWNISSGGFGLMRGKFMTLETALLNARYLHLLMRHSDTVGVACRSNMTNSLGSGVIETRPAGLLKRPSYHVMKLYAEHFQPVPVRVDGTLGNVDIMACASENRKALTIFAVNSATDPVGLSLDLSEYGPELTARAAKSVRDTLDARQPDVMNHWTNPARVTTTALPVVGNMVTLPALSVSAIEFAAP